VTIRQQNRSGMEPMVWVPQKEYKLIGAALAAARDRAGPTQSQLAKLLRKGIVLLK
jgi:hypothetical protein